MHRNSSVTFFSIETAKVLGGEVMPVTEFGARGLSG